VRVDALVRASRIVAAAAALVVLVHIGTCLAAHAAMARELSSAHEPPAHVIDHVPNVVIPLLEVGALVALAASACLFRRRTLPIREQILRVPGFIADAGRDRRAHSPPSPPVLCIWRC
jgi:hypothetical protein